MTSHAAVPSVGSQEKCPEIGVSRCSDNPQGVFLVPKGGYNTYVHTHTYACVYIIYIHI